MLLVIRSGEDFFTRGFFGKGGILKKVFFLSFRITWILGLLLGLVVLTWLFFTVDWVSNILCTRKTEKRLRLVSDKKMKALLDYSSAVAAELDLGNLTPMDVFDGMEPRTLADSVSVMEAGQTKHVKNVKLYQTDQATKDLRSKKKKRIVVFC